MNSTLGKVGYIGLPQSSWGIGLELLSHKQRIFHSEIHFYLDNFIFIESFTWIHLQDRLVNDKGSMPEL
jgi:hypothetical protein